jgi:hypothetical protein
MTKEQAIEFTTLKTLNAFTLARVIIYFDLIQDQTPTYPEITKYFSEQAYPFAENYLKNNFNINFQELETLEDSLFLNLTPFQ